MQELRDKINSIDSQIIKLLAERRQLSQEVIQKKFEQNAPIKDKEREEKLLSRLIKEGRVTGLDSHFITKIFHEIIDDSVRLQQTYLHRIGKDADPSGEILRVAIQGIEGAYSYLAAQQFFAHSQGELAFVKRKRFEEVVKAVENEEADFAMLPVENTTSGSINEVYDALLNTTLNIIGEEKFLVRHCLVGYGDAKISEIRKVYAHPQAAAQCSTFLQSLPNVRVEYFADTAMSARQVQEEKDPSVAGICSLEASQIFDVAVLKENIANQQGNYTRFVIGSREPVEVDERIPAKTSLVMATAHQAGSLVEALNVFRKHEINMTKLQSRPIIGNPWEEMFYVDFYGNANNDRVKNALEELGTFTKFFKVLGTYPAKDIDRTKVDMSKILQSDDTLKEQAHKVAEGEKKKPKKKSGYTIASREYKEEDTIIEVGGQLIGGDNFVVIAGPCSVESYDQIIETAREVKEHGGLILRGGCFKPRTSPYSFQGLGFQGLKYLKEAGETFGMPIITEVLSTDQVVEVAKHSDILQIGARNMQNFSLLTEVGKTHRPVMLKRGMMASIDELLHAAEYILKQGNRQVMLCERGIRTFETATRNTLDLSAIPVLKELTHLPIIVDPSHAVGERDRVAPLAKAAKIVGAHGIMIEIHPDPSKALSDGPQALYFNQYEELMRDLYKV